MKNHLDLDDIVQAYPNLIYGRPPRTKINVCGHIYEIYTGILDAYPDTLLGDSEKRDKYRLNDSTLFFHHHPSLFSYVLYYYIQGFVQRPYHTPSDVFREECRFFSIPFQADEDENVVLHYHEITDEEKFPSKSLSWISFVISTLSCLIVLFDDRATEYQLTLVPHTIVNWVDLSCSIWFMIEFYLRFFYLTNFEASSVHLQLFIDISSIAPIFFALVTHTLSHWFPDFILLYPFYICLKSFRVFRFIRYIPSLDFIRRTLLFSLADLSITFILCSLFIIPLGITIYLMERTDPSSTIADPNIGLSWAIETLTTIGFGEYIPHTYEGRILSIFTCVFGLIILTIPVPIVFRKFQIIYQNSLKRDLWIRYH